MAAVIAFAYQICGMFGIVPPIAEGSVVQGIGIVINLLCALGIIVDPTTVGAGDSKQALTYVEPKKD